MKLRITTLIENNPDNNGNLQYEHGLSFYVEVGETRILFDTGKSGAFVENAIRLKKELNGLDYCILSHGHYDHSGGVETLLNSVSNYPRFVMGEEFFQKKFKISDQPGYVYNGNPFEEDLLIERNIDILKIKDPITYLTDEIVIFQLFSKCNDFEKRNPKFFIKKEDDYVSDDFKDEIALGIVTEKGLVLFVGCSHTGIVNILRTVAERVNIPIYAVIGGTHLVDADASRIHQTINEIKNMNIEKIAVSHCTGEEGIRCLHKELPEKFIYNNTGNVIEL